MVIKRKKVNNFLIYDSECLMCQGFLTFLDKIYNNSKSNILVTSSPSKILSLIDNYHHNFISERILTLEKLSKNTIIYIKGDLIYIEFQAINNLLKDSSNKVLAIIAAILEFIIPKYIGNKIYKIIASRRIQLSNLFFKNKCNLFFKNLVILD